MKNFFFCINLILLFYSVSFPQSVRDEIKKIGGSPAYTGSWTPANLPIDTTTASVFFYGEAPRTKVAKDSGGVSVRPYMRVWGGDNLVANGTFDNNIDNWNLTKSVWAANEGGFIGTNKTTTTGTTTDDNASQISISTPISGGKYRLQMDINVATLGGGATLEVSIPRFNYSLIYNATGTYSIDTALIRNIGGSNFTTIVVRQATSGNTLFYLDNVFLTPIDSTYGYTYTIPRPSDTTTYYYSQSVWWKQKDKDTIWLAAETDTVTVYPYVAPEFEEGAYTSDGNELYTIDGNRIYAKQEGE